MKKFNKLKFLEFVGLLSARLNYQTLQFEKSNYLTFKGYLTVFLNVSFLLKQYVSIFYPQEDVIQLYIGNLSFPDLP